MVSHQITDYLSFFLNAKGKVIKIDNKTKVPIITSVI